MPVRQLPISGFVLAGGQSRRMGVDKATLELGGRAMVEIAVEKLRGFCAEVSIVGDREDLAGYAAVVRGERVGCGPGAGIEAGLRAAKEEWAMFVPVDVPLVPGELLKTWAEAVVGQAGAGCGVSFLLVRNQRQPAFCMVRVEGLGAISGALDRGARSLEDVLYEVDRCDIGWMWVCDAGRCASGFSPSDLQMESWFLNVNTVEEFELAEVWWKELSGVSIPSSCS